MGLDMYLTATAHIGGEHGVEIEGLDAGGLEISGINYRAGYWRKANAVHGWFVNFTPKFQALQAFIWGSVHTSPTAPHCSVLKSHCAFAPPSGAISSARIYAPRSSSESKSKNNKAP